MVPSEIHLTTHDYSRSKMRDGVEDDSYRTESKSVIRGGAANNTTFIRHAPRKSVMAEQERYEDDWSQKGILGEDHRNDDEADETQSVHGNGIHRVVEFQVHSSPATNAQS